MSALNFKFHLTAGRGTESFAECEVKNTFSQQTRSDGLIIQVRDGKILFQIPSGTDSYLDKILSLKSVERAFVTIIDYENDTKGKRNFLNKLMEAMSSTENYCIAKSVLDQLSSLMLKRNLSRDVPQEVSCNGEPPPKIARLQDSKLNQEHCSQSQTTSSNILINDEKGKLSSNNRLRSCEKEIFKSFRMSVKCSGKSGKWINLKKLSKDLSWRVSKASNWTVDLRNQDFEVCLHINDQHVTAGIPLTRKPLSRRPFILDPGLRAPVAWIMAHLAEIKPGDTVLDPMCGKGTLVLEACSSSKDAHFVGVDADVFQIQVAQQNIRNTEYNKCIDLFHANGLCLPFNPMSFDKVICDAPFNQKHFTSKNADEFYASFLQEMHRVLHKSGKFILLTSQDLSKIIIPQLQIPVTEDIPSPQKSSGKDDMDSNPIIKLDSSKLFQFVSKHYVKLGETHGEIIVMTKL